MLLVDLQGLGDWQGCIHCNHDFIQRNECASCMFVAVDVSNGGLGNKPLCL